MSMVLRFLLCLSVVCAAVNPRLEFIEEPPDFLEFYNDTGGAVRCVARGEGTVIVLWVLAGDGSPAGPVPALRQQLPDGTLNFPPFSASAYRPDFHATAYRCIARSPLGAIASRDLHVRALVRQPYKIQVFDEFSLKGNTAVLRCVIPSFIKKFVTVPSWIKDDSLTIIPSGDMGERYSIFENGELHIRNVTGEDGYKSYRCITKNRLSGEVIPSSSSGKLIVTDAHSDIPPRITHSQSVVTVDVGESVELPCAAQGHPPPTYTWYRGGDGFLLGATTIRDGGRFTVLDGSLVVRHVGVLDRGRYTCVVSNPHGQEKAVTDLVVREPLSVRIEPQLLSAELGRPAIFHCNVSGFPVRQIRWIKDLQALTSGPRISVSRHTLRLNRVDRDDRGFYQCVAVGDGHSSQGAAQLVLGEEMPQLKSTFQTLTVEPGGSFSLRCSAVGNPLPQVTWTLDSLQVPDALRFSLGDFVTSRGEVVSFVNVSTARVEDGGWYACRASSPVGEITHAAKVNVIGPPFVRTMPDLVLVEGQTLDIRCPVAGFPIDEVYWEHNNRRLPYNHRQRAFKNGTLIIQEMDRRADAGEYICVAKNSQGQKALRPLVIKVLSPPVIEPFQFPGVLEEGSRSKVLCSVTKGDPPITIRWSKDGGALEPELGATEATLDEFSRALIFPRVELRHRGNYTCTANNRAASASYTAAMVIHAPPRWTIEPSNAEAILGQDVVLNCAADGFPKPSIIWKKGDNSLAGDYSPILTDAHCSVLANGSLVIRAALGADAGYYMCQASNGIGSGISTVLQLAIRVSAHFTEEFRAKTVKKGESIAIKCQAFGDKPLSITWRKDGQALNKHFDKNYRVEDVMTDESLTSVLNIDGAQRDDSSLFTCHAVNTYGKDELNIQVIVQERPDRPGKLSQSDLSSRQITISWTPSYSGNSPIHQYLVQYRAEDAGRWEDNAKQMTVSGSDTKVTISGLLPATSYHFRAFAENSFGRSEPSQMLAVTTDMEVPGSPPQAIQVEPMGSQTIRVAWQPPPAAALHGRLKGYYVGYKEHGSTEPYTYKTLEMTESFTHECLVTNLRRLTHYSIVVQAFNSKGAGPPSDPVTIQTSDNDPPEPPQLTVVDTTPTSIHLRWDIRLDASSQVKGFVLYYKKELGSWQEATFSREKRDAILNRLHCGSLYFLYVAAFNPAGEGLPSETISARTRGAVPIAPAQPDFVTNVNSTWLSLQMDAWKDGGCQLGFFVVQYRTEVDEQWTVVADRLLPESEEPYILTGLNPGTWYRVQVAAHNEAGASTAEYNLRTLLTAAGPKPPTNQGLLDNMGVLLPVSIVALVLVALLTVIILVRVRACAFGRSSSYEYRKPATKSDAVELEAKQIKEEYLPSPYAASKMGYCREDSADSSIEDRAYDVPFAIKQGSSGHHDKGIRETTLVRTDGEHLYKYPGEGWSCQSGIYMGDHPGPPRSRSFKSRRWSREIEDEYVTGAFNKQPDPRWSNGNKQVGAPRHEVINHRHHYGS